MPLMTSLGEPFSVVGGFFKYSVEKLIPIRYFITWKTTEYVGYDAAQSYE